jgi:lanosterol synthase
MIEYEYPECTTSVITSLSIFQKHYPNYRAEEISWVFMLGIEYVDAIKHILPTAKPYGAP